MNLKEYHKIIVCGVNGVGKSTLGRKIAEEIGYQLCGLLLRDMNRYDNLILAAVKGDYGEEIESMFDCAVLISVPEAVRMERVRNRSFGRFGDRVLPGGDLYEREKRFWEMAAGRTEAEVREWLESLHIPIIRVDGTRPVDESGLYFGEKGIL